MKDLPSWLQAFAAVVALFVAVWGIIGPGMAAKRRERLQARCIATAIAPDLLSVEVQLDRVRSCLTALISKAGDHVGQSFSSSVMDAQINISSMLLRNIDNLYKLGEPAGPTCLQLVSVILQYNDLVQNAAANIIPMNKVEWAEPLRALDGHLKAIGMLLSQMQQEIKPLHDPR